jgi:hypothetical protein
LGASIAGFRGGSAFGPGTVWWVGWYRSGVEWQECSGAFDAGSQTLSVTVDVFARETGVNTRQFFVCVYVSPAARSRKQHDVELSARQRSLAVNPGSGHRGVISDLEPSERVPDESALPEQQFCLRDGPVE